MQTPLLEVALDLCSNLAATDRYERLLDAVRRLLPCDSAALLELVDGELIPVVTAGLRPDVLGRRFLPRQNPRLRRILAADGPVRFPADSDLPDPFDGLIAASDNESQRIHACMGAPLIVGDEVVGLLAIDSLDPSAFDDVDDEMIAVLAALAAAALRTAQLIDAIEYACARKGLATDVLVAEVQSRRGGQLLGESPSMKRLRDEVAMVGRSDLTVLIMGETGVGKELVARALHLESDRASQPLIYVNCAALPESIAESELFGHVRGAFTGATAARAGKFEAADHGTLFLDEVGELPLSIQPKLLRALQSGEIQRVGSDACIEVDVRVIAATNRDLVSAVRRGRFRADLYHRLSVYPLVVPPLRERREDIPLLASFFLDQARSRLGLGPVRLTPAARDALMGIEWPGNVRELEHVILRAALRAAKDSTSGIVTVHTAHLGLPTTSGPALELCPPILDGSRSLREVVDDFQRQVIRATLDDTNGNWAECARRLQLDRGNLHRLGKRLGLKPAGTAS